MNLTNTLGLPDAFVDAVRNDPYVGGGDISVTKLIDAPQRRVLYKKFKEFVVEDVSERVWSLMGQAVHTVLERANTSALVEQRLFMEVNGWTLSGQFDRLHLEDRTLQDWKVTTTYKSKGDSSWERQLNILRLLAHNNGHVVDRLQVVAIYRDWSRAKARVNEDYPQSNVQILEVPVWSLDETYEYVQSRVRMHQAAEEGEVVPCSEEERWFQGSTFALMKKGGKRAIRIAVAKEELGEPAEGYFIEERRGANKRCEEFCEVSSFCDQYKQYMEKNNADVDS